MENIESIIEELEKFEKSKSGVDIPKVLEEYLQHVAKTGDTVFPWHRIRYFLRHMLATVMNEFYENCGGEDMSECGNIPAFSYTTTRDKLLHHFDTFTGAPFTIQRLCEIMVDPTRHYKRTDKFLRGLEKNVLVVSIIEPGRPRRNEDAQQTLVNGLQESGLHTPPLSSSCPTSPVSLHSKRITLTQATNSVANNTSESYSQAVIDSGNQVMAPEANGPSSVQLDERNGESVTETTEPPTKKAKTERTYEEKATGSAECVSQVQEKGKPYSPHETENMEAEASEDVDNTSNSIPNSAKTEVLDSGESAAMYQTVKPINNKETKTTNERRVHQVGTSEVVTQDSPELAKEVRQKIEVKDDTMSVTPEVCSSNNSHRSVTQKLKEKNDTVGSLSTAVAIINAEGSPDSAGDTAEVVHQQQEHMEEAHKDEREGSSEAAASNTRSEAAHLSEGSCIQGNQNSNSHEADSTSQAQNSILSQPAASVSGTSASTMSSLSSTDLSSVTPPATSVAPSITSPPDAAVHTTSQTLSSASSTSASANASSPVRDIPDLTTGVGTAASSSTRPPKSDSVVGQEPDHTSSDSSTVESSNKNEKDIANVSCSSSPSNESEVKNQLVEED